MIINIHKLYLLKKFSKKIFLMFTIFFALVSIINLIEESNFLRDTDSNFLTPFLLTLLNTPSILYEMLPFIFILSTQFFFIDIYEKKEIYTLRQFGLNNFDILKFLSLNSLIYGILIVIIFYNFSAILKNEYLKIKNNYTNDNKYLAAITKNGLWIKDSSKEEIIIINADKIESNYLFNTTLSQFDKDYKLKKNIIAEKIDIKDFDWILYNATITETDNLSKNYKEISFKSNFNSEKINNLFSDLKALTYFDLQTLKKNYESIGYSTDEINLQNHKIYSLPFLLMLMTVISMIIMINNKFQKNLLFNILIGILFSVIVYYLSHFSNLLGENGKLPLILSVWFPVLIILIVSLIGIVKLNEK
ncbi:LptF/LptG family permease [Candidatus Pelagibacter sp.]|nr:LptF/LptG family permease [Candidatus Pelagibacter sp.]